MNKISAFHVVAPTKRKQIVDARIGLYNPAFRYVKACNTDLRATFDRIRAELAKGKA